MKGKHTLKEVEHLIHEINHGNPVNNSKDTKKNVFPHLEQRNFVLPRRYDVSDMVRSQEPKREQLLRNESSMMLLENKISGLNSQHVTKLKEEAKKAFKIKKGSKKKLGYKKRNMRDKDMTLFNNIFVKPRKERLQTLKKNIEIKDEETKKQDKILKMYQEKEAKKFRIYEEDEPDEALEKMKDITRKPDNYEIYNKSLLKKLSKGNLKNSELTGYKGSKSVMHSKTFNKNLLENVSMSVLMNDSVDNNNLVNQSVEFLGSDKGIDKNVKMIFNQQIQVEPPDLPNAHSSSPIAPGLGWAPSIPYIVEDESRLSIGDLLTRARAGMQAGEVQQEAHLSFYLGITYENKRRYHKVIYS